MTVTFRQERANIYRLDIAGRLRKRDLDTVQRLAEPELGDPRRIRLLVVLTGFEGWEETDQWRDLDFYVRHGEAIERIAIVADERWRSEALMFAAADLRSGLVEFFPADRAEEAWSWLAEDDTRSAPEQAS